MKVNRSEEKEEPGIERDGKRECGVSFRGSGWKYDIGGKETEPDQNEWPAPNTAFGGAAARQRSQQARQLRDNTGQG